MQEAWQSLAHPDARFGTAAEIRTTVAPGSRVCPPGWCGILTIAGRTLATAPDRDQARALDDALRNVVTDQHTDPASLREHLTVADVLGPAHLAYLPDGAVLRAVPSGDDRVDVLTTAAPSVAALLVQCPPDDVAESGMDEITSPAFLLTRGGQPSAVAGYRLWPNHIAHLSVLTLPGSRGAGLARVVAAAASDHARRAGLLCQWRARPAATLRVAEAIGYRVLGRQVSLQLARWHRATRSREVGPSVRRWLPAATSEAQ